MFLSQQPVEYLWKTHRRLYLPMNGKKTKAKSRLPEKQDVLLGTDISFRT